MRSANLVKAVEMDIYQTKTAWNDCIMNENDISAAHSDQVKAMESAAHSGF